MPRKAPGNEETQESLSTITRKLAEINEQLVMETTPERRELLKAQLTKIRKEKHTLQMRIRTRASRQKMEEYFLYPIKENVPAWFQWEISSPISDLKVTAAPEPFVFQRMQYPVMKSLSDEEIHNARQRFKKSMEEIENMCVQKEVEAYANSLPPYKGKYIACPNCSCTDARIVIAKDKLKHEQIMQRKIVSARLIAAESAFVKALRMLENGEATADGLEFISVQTREKAKAAYRAQFLRIFINAKIAQCEYADVNADQKRGPKHKPKPGYCLLLPLDEGEKCMRWRAVYTSRAHKDLLLWAHRQVIKGYRNEGELLASQEDEGQDSSSRARDQEADGGVGGS